MKLKIWIWQHNWEDGNNIQLFPDAKAAQVAVQTYVHEQWNNGYMDDEEYPGDSPKAVEAYFKYHEDTEYYNIYRQNVDFSAELVDPKLAKDEVILNEDECNLITCVLRDVTYKRVAGLLGANSGELPDLIHTVVEKLKM